MNAIIGDNGVITNAQKAKTEAEEAELWEKVQMVLVEGMGQDLDREKYVEEVNNKFKNQGLEAKIGLRADGYAVTYGKYSRKVVLLSDDLQILGEIVAIEGSNELWDSETKEDGTLRLTGYKGKKEGDIQIPNIIDGKFVTEIGAIFSSETGIKSINIPEGIEVIGAKAFFGCTGLDCKIIFPSSLKEIGESAFYQCVGIQGDLNSIVEQGITTGKNAFYKCGKMTGNIKVLIDTLGEDVTEIEEGQFSGFSGLTGTLKIPARITAIKDNAFSGCNGIEKIEFEEESELKTIGNYSFSKCSGVKGNLVLPDTITSIGDYAFNECSGLTGLDLGENLISLGDFAFYYCSNLCGEIEIPVTLDEVNYCSFSYICKMGGNLTVKFKTESEGMAELSENKERTLKFADRAFANSGVTKIVLPTNRRTEMGMHCFLNCGGLTDIENSRCIGKIGTSALQSTGMLKSLDISEDIKLESGAFTASGLTSLDWAKNLKIIPDRCFYNCWGFNLDIVVFLENSSINEIGSRAFENCINLTGEFSGEIKKKIGDTEGNENSKIKLGQSVFLGTKVVQSIKLDIDENGYLALGDNKKIEDSMYAGVTNFKDSKGNDVKNIKIPEGVNYIGVSAFEGCSSIEKIEIPYSVSSIGKNAFRGCSKLIDVNFISNVENFDNQTSTITKLPSGCFQDCKKLENINIPSSISDLGDSSFANSGIRKIDLSNVTKLGGSCFNNCSNLENFVKFNDGLESIPSACFCGTKIGYRNDNEEMKEIVIPDSVTSLGGYVFSGCKELEKIVVGSGVSKVGVYFVDNSPKLKNIEFKGIISSIDSFAFLNCSSLQTIKFAEGTVLTSIGENAFKNCSSLGGEININSGVEYDDENVFFNCNIKRRFVD